MGRHVIGSSPCSSLVDLRNQRHHTFNLKMAAHWLCRLHLAWTANETENTNNLTKQFQQSNKNGKNRQSTPSHPHTFGCYTGVQETPSHTEITLATAHASTKGHPIRRSQNSRILTAVTRTSHWHQGPTTLLQPSQNGRREHENECLCGQFTTCSEPEYIGHHIHFASEQK